MFTSCPKKLSIGIHKKITKQEIYWNLRFIHNILLIHSGISGALDGKDEAKVDTISSDTNSSDENYI